MLIVTNGDMAAERIRTLGLDAEVLPWRDVLHDGPVRPAPTLQAQSAARAGFLAAMSGRPEAEVAAGVVADAATEKADATVVSGTRNPTATSPPAEARAGTETSPPAAAGSSKSRKRRRSRIAPNAWCRSDRRSGASERPTRATRPPAQVVTHRPSIEVERVIDNRTTRSPTIRRQFRRRFVRRAGKDPHPSVLSPKPNV